MFFIRGKVFAFVVDLSHLAKGVSSSSALQTCLDLNFPANKIHFYPLTTQTTK